MRNDINVNTLRYGESIYFVMMTTAEQFYMSYLLCKKEKEKYDNDLMFLKPSVVLLALSCELYLKALYAFENNVSKKNELPLGHELDKLYRRLEELRNDVLEKFNEKYKRRYPNKEKYSYDSFALKLKQHRNVFKKWRYPYEDGIGPVNLIFLECVYEACKDVLDEKNPALVFRYPYDIDK